MGKKIIAKISTIDRYISKNHPLLGQFLVQFIAGILVVLITAVWALNTIPPKPTYEVEKLPNNTSQIVIKNEGILPANAFYNVVTDSTVTMKPDIKLGDAHVKVTAASSDKYNIQLKDLPKNQRAIVFFNTGNIEISQE